MTNKVNRDSMTTSDREDHAENEYDLYTAEQYRAEVVEAIRAAWQTGDNERLGTDRSSYYDTTTYRLRVNGAGIDARTVRRVLSERDGHSMAYLGAAGGYSTVGLVTLDSDGSFIVESVYHIGD